MLFEQTLPLIVGLENPSTEKSLFDKRVPSGSTPVAVTCQQTTVNVWSFRCYATASRAFSNQLLRSCLGSHLQILFKVEMARGVFSRLFHSDLWIETKKVPIRRSYRTPNFG